MTRIVMNQFRNVDGSEATMTLGQITANQEYDDGLGDFYGFGQYDNIQLFGVDGITKGMLAYCSKGFIEDYWGDVGTPGWYPYNDAQSGSFANCKNGEILMFGEGFVVKAGNGMGITPALTFSGEVKSAPTEIPGANFKFTGNCTPVEITLGQITTNQSYDDNLGDFYGFGQYDSIQFFTKEGTTEGMLAYCSKGFIEDYWGDVGTPGWYKYAEAQAGNFSNCLNDRKIPAGTAFVLKAGNGNGVAPTITIPSALK